MARAPFRCVSDFFSLLNKNDGENDLIALCANDSLIREALTIASPSLCHTMNNKKDSKQVLASLVKYYSRMTTRSTPFGLFSFVSMGSIEEVSHVYFDLSKVHKRARPDMGWLIAVIDKLCQDPALLPSLSIRKNPLVLDSGGRVYLNYVRKESEDENKKTVSIRSSFLIDAILQNTKTPIGVGELQHRIMAENPTLDSEKVLEVIKQLLKQQFLSFDLLPSLLTESPFNDLLSKFSFISAPKTSIYPLIEIEKKINEYNKTIPGVGVEKLQQIQQEMGLIASSQHTIQVDSVYKGNKITLSKTIAHELGEAVEVLWRLSHVYSHSHILKPYHERFLEKYGIHRVIPILELLSEGCGLGVPEVYKLPMQDESSGRRQSKWEKWIGQQWSECILQRKKEVQLTDQQLDMLLESPDKKKALLSFDLFCEIIANSQRHLENGDYLLLISSFSRQGGATFGRFLDLFDEYQKEQLRVFHLAEEDLEKEKMFAQSSYLSISPRSANVAIQPNLRRYSINLEDSGSISLDNIVVGAMQDRFYLKIKDQPKELIVTAGNMLSPFAAPAPLRFMRDVSASRHQAIMSFPWIDLEKQSFLPRVCYKKTILSTAQWRVDLLHLGSTEKDNSEIIEKKFNEWANRWELPRYCFMGDGDQRILIDRSYPAHLREIVQQLKKGRSITLKEKVGEKEGQWAKSDLGNHFCEFVIPFSKNPKYTSSEERLTFPQNKAISTKSRWKLPGSEWLYAKFYLDAVQETRFLLEHCSRFCKTMLQQNIITDWFFVRYSDSRPHIRLRFRGDQSNIISYLLPALHNLSLKLLEDRSIQEMAIASYEREVERYGGEELIEFAEAFFSADSITTLSLLAIQTSKKTQLSEECIAALSLLDILKQFRLSSTQQIELLSAAQSAKEGLKGFRQYKNLLMSLGEAVEQNNLAEHEEGVLLSKAFEMREGALAAFTNHMHDLGHKQQLASTPEVIKNSLLHMHCNRLLGRDRKKEVTARLYAQHILKLIAEKRSAIAKS